MASAEVVADWAWISKDPSAGIGYSVLKVSTDAIDFGTVFGNYGPGAPSSTTAPDAPDAPPWVTYGPGDGGREGVLISVSARDLLTQRDHTGRPVWSQRQVVMRYAALAEVGASFQTVWAAVCNAPVPTPDGTPLLLTVNRQLPDGLIQVVEANFDSLAAIAAGLLDGPVVIADASHLPREGRLGLLDAVAALLPYGYRADLSASSAVNNTVKHRIRLVLADFANPDQQLLSLLASQHSPRGDISRRYLAALHEKRRKNGTALLVRHLWDIRWEDGQRPCSFSRPGFALAALHELDFLGTVKDALAKGQVPAELMGKFFSDPDSQQMWDTFDAERRDNAVRSLAGGGGAAAAVLVRSWSLIGVDVIRCANRNLDAGSVEIAASCLNLIGQTDDRLEDRVLADLLVPEHVEPDVRSRRPAVLIELLRKRRVPTPGEYAYTCDEIRFGDAAGWQAGLVCGLLASELAAGDAGERALGWVRWLCRSQFSEVSDWERPDWVNALDLPDSGGDGGRAESAMRALIRRDQQAVSRGNCWSAVFLNLAHVAGRLTELVETVGRQLMELTAALSRGDQSPLATAIRATLGPPSLKVETFAALAQVDVMRVLLGVPPSAALIELDDPAALHSYLDALDDALRAEVMRPRLPELEEGFLRLARSGTTKTGQLTAGGIRVLNAWSDDPERQAGLIRHVASLSLQEQPVDIRLSQKFWSVLSDYPPLADYAVSGQLITAADWTQRNPAVAFLREDTGEAVTTTRLARACFEAWCAGRRAEGIVRTLASALTAGIPPRQLDDTLREFQDLLYRFGTPAGAATPEVSKQALFECWRLVLAGAFGDGYAQEFGEYLRHRLRGEAEIRTHLLTTLFLPAKTAQSRKPDSSLVRLYRWIAGPKRKPTAIAAAGRQPAESGLAGSGDAGSGHRGSHANRP